MTALPCGCDHDLEDCLCGCEYCQIEDSYVCFEKGCCGGYYCPHRESQCDCDKSKGEVCEKCED